MVCIGGFNRILFVSTTDTSVGPMAEVIMKQLLQLRGHRDLEVYARGTVVLFSEPANPKAVAALRNMGLILGNRNSIELLPEDISDDTLVLAVGLKEKEFLIENFELRHVYTIAEYAGVIDEISDPYGKDVEGYLVCAGELKNCIETITDRIYGK